MLKIGDKVRVCSRKKYDELDELRSGIHASSISSMLFDEIVTLKKVDEWNIWDIEEDNHNHYIEESLTKQEDVMKLSGMKLKKGMKLRLKERRDCGEENLWITDGMEKYFGGEVTFSGASLSDNILVEEDGEVYAWDINWFEDYQPENKEYYFKDTDIDFVQLCNDALVDDVPSFIVIGGDKAYVGLIQSGKSVGVPATYDDFLYSGSSFINSVSDLPYGIFEISKDKIDIWIKKLKQYSVDYKAYRDDLDTNIKDRERKDYVPRNELKSFKVIQF